MTQDEKDRDKYIFKSTGRTFYANCGIIGIARIMETKAD